MSNILEKFKLDDKIAIVTGASQGLGASMAVGLAEAGADVVLVARGDLSGTQQLIENTGRKALLIQADLGDREQTKAVVSKVVAEWGAPDILVNNAGTIRRNDFVDFTEKDWDDVLEINLSSQFFLTQQFVKSLTEADKGGKVVNIASMLSFQGGIRVPSYTASKSGVMGLTRLMANELAGKGIQVNAIAPGYMATENTQPLREDAERNKAILARIPAGKWGDPDDINGAVVFLSSAAANYVTGYTLAVDGGWLAR